MSWYDEYDERIFFKEFQIKKEYVLVTNTWFSDLDTHSTSLYHENKNPIFLKGLTANEWNLANDKIIKKSTEVSVGFWSGIFQKWKDCQSIDKKNLSKDDAIEIKFQKLSDLNWRIVSIKKVR
jgi:hypothetical protein